MRICNAGKTSRGIYGVQKIAARDEAADNRILRAPLPGQILRRGINSRRTVGET